MGTEHRLVRAVQLAQTVERAAQTETSPRREKQTAQDRTSWRVRGGNEDQDGAPWWGSNIFTGGLISFLFFVFAAQLARTAENWLHITFYFKSSPFQHFEILCCQQSVLNLNGINIFFTKTIIN